MSIISLWFKKMLPKRKYHPRGKLIHGYEARKHPLYTRHNLMLQRCFDPENKSYKNYGLRGITVCRRWFDFENYALDMGLPPHEYATVERVNNNGNYEPDNCEWKDRTQQCLNRRDFKNNTSGKRGVVEIKGRFEARYDEYNTRFNLGRFATVGEASTYRETFIKLLHTDPEKAMQMTERRSRHDSRTGIKGISKRSDGYYTVRTTIEGVRKYHGCSKDLAGAIKILEKIKCSMIGW